MIKMVVKKPSKVAENMRKTSMSNLEFVSNNPISGFTTGLAEKLIRDGVKTYHKLMSNVRVKDDEVHPRLINDVLSHPP